VPDGCHGLIGSVGKGGDGSGRGDHSPVIGGGMGGVALITIAGRQPPALRGISQVIPGIVPAVFVVDQAVVPVLFPVISVWVLQVSRIESQKGVVAEE
jgi:hypothetical protein